MTMEEILQDPKTSWEEIRLALKSEGHATNGGVMLALINATEALSKEAGYEEDHSILHDVTTTTKPEDHNHHEVCLQRSQSSDEVLSNNDTPMIFGYKQPCTRKPAIKNPRRGFTFLAGRGKSSDSINRATSTSSHCSNNTSHSVNSSLASVDMMDFGVDHDAIAYSIEMLNEIESRRGTQHCITNDDDERSCPTNGFLDWNHDDESSAYPSQQVGPEGSSPDKQDIHTDDQKGAAESERPQAPKVRRRESWNIEDYDFEPVRQHPRPVIPSMLRTLSSSLLSKLSLELGSGTFPQDDRCGPQEVTTDEVKKSLHLSFSRANKYRLHSDSNSRRASC